LQYSGGPQGRRVRKTNAPIFTALSQAVKRQAQAMAENTVIPYRDFGSSPVVFAEPA